VLTGRDTVGIGGLDFEPNLVGVETRRRGVISWIGGRRVLKPRVMAKRAVDGPREGVGEVLSVGWRTTQGQLLLIHHHKVSIIDKFGLRHLITANI